MKKKVVLLASHSFSRWPLLGLWLGLMIASGPRSGSAASHPPNEHPRTQAILVLGDSLSAGYGLERREAYPALLWKKAADAGFNVMVMNAAVSGGTTAGGLRRLPGLLRRHRIDVLVVELGINDLFGGVPVSQIEENLQKIVDLTKARYPKAGIVIAGLQVPGYASHDAVSAFGSMYVELARRNHAALVPFLLDGVVGNPALNQDDFIHPNAMGQKVLAANVWPVLEKTLRQEMN